MDIHKASAGQAWHWIKQGFTLFLRNPLLWIVFCIISIVIAVLLSKIPYVGAPLAVLLSPVFSAGFMFVCKTLDNNDEIDISHLFSGFTRNTNGLIAIGGFYLISIIILAWLAQLLIGEEFLKTMAAQGKTPAPVLDLRAFQGSLLLLCLFIPVLMAIWFSPALVMLNNVRPVQALKLSFIGCLKNTVPFLVFGFIAFILTIVASIPFGLGWLVLMPTLTASIYVGYKDIFSVPSKREVQPIQSE